ncbi:serpin family protein [Pandoraea pneumonica]|uniref:serpin family protein n=1 Tax=Pandoraea pneumonica TaxID=2508299 RepID=UPI003CE7B947
MLDGRFVTIRNRPTDNQACRSISQDAERKRLDDVRLRQRHSGHIQADWGMPNENRLASFASDLSHTSTRSEATETPRGALKVSAKPPTHDSSVAHARSLVFDALRSQRIPADENWAFETRSCLHASAYIANVYNGDLPNLSDTLTSLQSRLRNSTHQSIKLKDFMMVIGDTQTLRHHEHLRATSAARRYVDTHAIAKDNLPLGETLQTLVDQRVKAFTEGAISHVELQPNPTPRPTLLNCFLFEGPWHDPFERENTRQGVFHLPSGERKHVSMMREPGEYQDVGLSVNGFDAVVVRCVGDELQGSLRMIYALPMDCPDPNHELFDALLKRLSAPGTPYDTLGLSARYVDFRVPRFDLTTKADVTPSALIAHTDRDVVLGPDSIGMRQVIRMEHHESGFRAAGTQETWFADNFHCTPTPLEITLDRPFYMLLTTQGGLPLLAMHITDPVPDAPPIVDASPAN